VPEQLSLDWTLDSTEARVLGTLRLHQGRARAITVPVLAREVGVGQRQVQSVIRRLVVEHGIPICSGGAGIWLAATADELLASYREQRRKAIQTLIRQRAIVRTHLARLRGQQELVA